jgi:predicted phosphodiesterase
LASNITRIFSDLHYGDRASQVRSLAQLTPLFEGVDTVVLNGDTIDTRPGPYPERTAAIRAEMEAFLKTVTPRVVLLTGNHDPDLTALHLHELAGGRVLVTHGDVLFSDIVPWGRDVPTIRERIIAARAAYLPAGDNSVEARLAIFRSVCASLRQRHQAERNPWKYAVSFIRDTFWPPGRMLRIFRAWREAPERAAALAREHRPKAQFIIIGHLHRPGVWTAQDGRVTINTGAFCRPLGASVVDLSPGRIVVRRVQQRDGAFHVGRIVAEFALAEA